MPLPTENEEQDLLKWEKMYYSPMQQMSSSGQFDSQSNSIDGSNSDVGFATTKATTATTITTALDSSSSSDIRVITFDLDNTIWKTSETISDANDALAAHLLNKHGIVERSEKRMGQLFRQYPERYAGVDYIPSMIDNLKDSIDDEGTSDIVQNVGQTERQIVRTTKSENNESDGVHIQSATKMKPVYLTLLRKDAIRSLLLAKDDDSSTNNLSTTTSVVDLEKQIDTAFDVWMEARCQSISKNFVPCAVSTLQQLRSQQLLASDAVTTATATATASSTSKKIYIGAITDGNSNPNQVPELSGLFDFVVRAEDVGVSKPDARVYKAAVASLMTRLMQDGQNIEEFFLGGNVVDDEIGGPPAMYVKSDASSQVLTWKDIDDDAVDAFSDGVGPWWVHVGDDFFKDVVAAKEFQMRTVWTRELIGGNEKVSTDRTNGSSNSNISNNNNTNLINGNSVESRQRSVSDLVNDIAKSEDGVLKMSIGASEFLSQTIHTEFSDAILDRFGDLGALLLKWHSEGSTKLQANNKIVEALVSEEMSAIEGSTGRLQPVEDLLGRETSDPKNKFCISCGRQLAIIAKFCSHCGEKQ